VLYVFEKAPAKINLLLDVLRKRSDGYHDMEMVMTTIDLADRIIVTKSSDHEIYVESNSGMIPRDERNLAYRAGDLLKRKLGVREGARILITKNIPVAAGLAGGSSDAATTLRALNRLWNTGLTNNELAEIGIEIGSDIPFCIYGNTAIVKGRGECVTPIPSLPLCWIVLAKPTHGVSTGDVFQLLEADRIEHHPDVNGMVQAIKHGDYDGITKNLGNVLESVTMELCPEVQKIKEKMIQFGADGALMSGSGPTIYGLVQKESRVRRIVNGLKGFCKQVYAVRVLAGSPQRQETGLLV
jgi:4-diphosphocytidyl-2-C-methyl-D-erythritol kinase